MSDSTGVKNSTNGTFALFNNTTGNSNTAGGVAALLNNSMGFNNTAIGYNALLSNTTAGDNTAIGTTALFSNVTGEFNTGIGSQTLRNNVSGGSTTSIGDSAGFNISGSDNVCIGAGVNGVAGENKITCIRNVYESVATERAVYVTSDNRPVFFRYKKDVDPTRVLFFGLIA